MKKIGTGRRFLARAPVWAVAGFAMCVSGGLFAGAGDAQAETLRDALVAAYGSNPDLQSERARLRATDEQIPQALSGWRPSVVASGSFGSVTSDSEIAGISGFAIPGVSGSNKTTVDPLTTALTITQPVFNGGQTLFGTRQAEASVMAGREVLRDAEQSTLLDVVTAFMDVLRDDAVVSLREKNVEVLQRQREAAQDRFDVGEITRTDVAQSEARLSGSNSNLISAQGALTRSRAAYERVVGHRPGDLEQQEALPAVPTSEEEAMAIALENNPILLSTRHAERASAQAVKVAKGALLPSVSLQAEYQYAEDPSSSVSRTEQTTATARLSVPLFQGGAVYSRVREAKQTNSQNRLQIASAQRQVEEAVANSWELLRTAQARLVSDQEQVTANEIALEGVQQEAQVGSRTTLDVLDAEQELLDARVALVGAERDESVAIFTLLSAVGRLSAQGLGLQTDYYDPEDNLDDVRDRWIGYGIRDE